MFVNSKKVGTFVAACIGLLSSGAHRKAQAQDNGFAMVSIKNVEDRNFNFSLKWGNSDSSNYTLNGNSSSRYWFPLGPADNAPKLVINFGIGDGDKRKEVTLPTNRVKSNKTDAGAAKYEVGLGSTVWDIRSVSTKPPVVAGKADEPDPSLPPTYGSVKLKAGFLPDPYKLDLLSGGLIKRVQRDATIYCSKAPDFSLHYTKGDYALYFHAGSSVGGTFLLINLPDGKWVGDGEVGRNPMVKIDKPESGRYDIFVGAIGKNLAASTLLITERSEGVAESLRDIRKLGAVPKKQPAVAAKPVRTVTIEATSDSGSALTGDEAAALVERHNEVRGELSLPDVKWSPTLAKTAQQWADEIARTGVIKHGSVDGKHYGQNLYYAYGAKLGPVDAADSWYHEKGAYVRGTPTSGDLRAGHYTQMIWRATTAIGAGKATIKTGIYQGWVVHVCDYNPPGNYFGQIAESSK